MVWETDATTAIGRSSSRIRYTKTGSARRGALRRSASGRYRTFNVASAQEPEQVQGIRATASLFTVLGVARRSAASSPRRKKSRVIASS